MLIFRLTGMAAGLKNRGMTTAPTFKRLYEAFSSRDVSYDGLYFIAVKTTRIFCRPVCPARTPLAKNVEFFRTARESLEAGYRPCLRCRPLDMGVKPPVWVQQLMKRIEENPSLPIRDRDLRGMGIEPERARRWFKSNYGMTFQGYHRSRRIGLALKQMKNGADPVEAAMNQGYESESGFRDAFARILGSPPKRAGEVETLACRWIETPLGPMMAAADDRGLCLFEFADPARLERQVNRIQQNLKASLIPGDHPILVQTEREMKEYFDGSRTEFTIPLNYQGTPFQMKAWKALLDIPYGQTSSYGEQAKRVGDPKAVRAVAAANGANRIAIIIPCHRVIASTGALHGYGGGLWRKQKLLELESGERSLF